MIQWCRYKCANCHKILCQMYIIACRAHFCYLPGLGQVGHSPRGTSGSAGTLDWSPMWSGSQFTCHPQCPDTLYTPAGPNDPLNPYTPYQPPADLQHPTPLAGPSAPTHPASPLTPLHL